MVEKLYHITYKEFQQTVIFITNYKYETMFIGKQEWYLHQCKSLMVMACNENTHSCLSENKKPVKSTL